MITFRSLTVLATLAAAASGVAYADGKHAMPHEHRMAPPEAAKRPNPVNADHASIEQGKKLFEANCTSCHGAQGRGDGPAGKALKPRPADLVRMAPSHTDGDFAWKIAEGRGPMPSWKAQFNESQIWDLANYLKRGLSARR
jgi:mono/diheme cytochrome c family protein